MRLLLEVWGPFLGETIRYWGLIWGSLFMETATWVFRIGFDYTFTKRAPQAGAAGVLRGVVVPPTCDCEASEGYSAAYKGHAMPVARGISCGTWPKSLFPKWRFCFKEPVGTKSLNVGMGIIINLGKFPCIGSKGYRPSLGVPPQAGPCG